MFEIVGWLAVATILVNPVESCVPRSRMATEASEESPPFTPEQLVWIDKMVSAHQAAMVASISTSDRNPPPGESAPTSASGTTPLVTTVSQPGESLLSCGILAVEV